MKAECESAYSTREYGKTQISCRLDTQKLKLFRSRYPGIMSRYFQSCIDYALLDKRNLERILFYNIFKEDMK